MTNDPNHLPIIWMTTLSGVFTPSQLAKLGGFDKFQEIVGDHGIPNFTHHFVPWFFRVADRLTYLTNAEVGVSWSGRPMFGLN